MPRSADEVELPSTLERSSGKAQRTYAETLVSAEAEYDDEARAHRVAYGALKHSFEKVGDHWEAKDHRGPSDEQSAQGGRQAVQHPRRSRGGVDANASKSHLYDLARRLDVPGRSRMSKEELADAIESANAQRTSQARSA